MWRSTAAPTNVLDGNSGLGAMHRSTSSQYLNATGINNQTNERWSSSIQTSNNLQADKHFVKNSNANDAKISVHVNYRYAQAQQPPQPQQQQQNGSRERARPVSMYEQQAQHYQRTTNNGDFVTRMSPAAALGVGVTRSESLFFGGSKVEQRQFQQQQQQHHHPNKHLNKPRRRQTPNELVCYIRLNNNHDHISNTYLRRIQLKSHVNNKERGQTTTNC